MQRNRHESWVLFAIRGFHPEVSPSDFIFRRAESVREKRVIPPKNEIGTTDQPPQHQRGVSRDAMARGGQAPRDPPGFVLAGTCWPGGYAALRSRARTCRPHSAYLPGLASFPAQENGPTSSLPLEARTSRKPRPS
jgi:hypothetical protein